MSSQRLQAIPPEHPTCQGFLDAQSCQLSALWDPVHLKTSYCSSQITPTLGLQTPCANQAKPNSCFIWGSERRINSGCPHPETVSLTDSLGQPPAQRLRPGSVSSLQSRWRAETSHAGARGRGLALTGEEEEGGVGNLQP